MAVDLKALKTQLIEGGYDVRRVTKSIAYLSTNDNASKHNQLELYSLIVKYLNAGTNLDGVNVVLTGKNMGLITYHGFMNKVKASHKNVFFDIQLVREGDKFNFKKKDGKVEYTHEIGNPFENGKIIGSYCIVKFDNGNESLELLNDRDFSEMKSSSRNQSTWNKWESEFWRKSVIKRACKVYFAEEIEALNSLDNQDFGLEEETPEETKKKIVEAHKNAKNSEEKPAQE